MRTSGLRRPAFADPVCHAAAIRVKQTPGEVPRIPRYDLLLPGSQLDAAFVLSPGTVLGKQAGPVLGRAFHFRAADPLDAANAGCRYHRSHRGLGGADEPGPVVAAFHVQRIAGPAAVGDVPVAEVKAEQVGVGGLV
jgi:hypothetical protein